MPTIQGKYWCWTLNNPTVEEHQVLELLDLEPLVQYLVFQKEQGLQGTPHFQGYLELSSRKTISQVRNLLGGRAHVERRKGTPEEARTYCMKDDGRLDGPWEFGVFVATTGSTNLTGRRTDLITIKERITRGASEREIADEFFGVWCQYHGAFRRFRTLVTSNRQWKTNVTVIVGPPGTGKSRYAMDNYPEAYWKQRSQWWDNYEGQDSVVLDDFYGWLPYDVLLRICDRYPLLVETKGSQANFCAKYLLITSNATPAQWYKNVVIEAFVRRIDKWMYFGANGQKLETTDYGSFCNAVERTTFMLSTN